MRFDVNILQRCAITLLVVITNENLEQRIHLQSPVRLGSIYRYLGRQFIVFTRARCWMNGIGEEINPETVDIPISVVRRRVFAMFLLITEACGLMKHLQIVDCRFHVPDRWIEQIHVKSSETGFRPISLHCMQFEVGGHIPVISQIA